VRLCLYVGEEKKMSIDDSRVLNAASFRLKRYEVRMDFWKVIIGTGLVGVVAALFPAIVSFYDSWFSSKKVELELKVEKQKFYQTFIENFADEGYNQDIELRIRLSNYFSSVADDEYSKKWKLFHDLLVAERDTAYSRIDEILFSLSKEQVKDKIDQDKISKLTTELSRLNKRMGFFDISPQPKQKLVSVIPDFIRPIETSRYLEVFGAPSSKIGNTCGQLENKAISDQIQTRRIDTFSFTMNTAALQSLESILVDLKAEDPEDYGKLGSLGGLCVRNLRGGSGRISNHSFGFEVDFSIDGKLPFTGVTSGEEYLDLRRIAPYFTKKGWAWGGNFAIPDAIHFGVGAELFESWVSDGSVKSVKADEVSK
jgi:D-alanyl-D-alanine carboxypeptidase